MAGFPAERAATMMMDMNVRCRHAFSLELGLLGLPAFVLLNGLIDKARRQA